MKHSNISLFVPHAGCPHLCSFCNQKTISGSVKPLSPADVRETLSKAATDNLCPETTEIAFFGGSFTAIDRSYMVSLLEETRPYISSGIFSGIRVSTRPDAIDSDVLSVLQSYGVTSIELGAQSLDDEVLSLNRRGHTAADVYNACKLIKEHGFSLGLQMMTGLYGDTDEKTLNTAKKIIEIGPETVRIYPTIILENTYLGELFKAGRYRAQTVDEAARICSVLLKLFYDADIRVIRLGLHSGGNVEEGYLSGPYHPAFGEICESLIYLEEARNELASFKNEGSETKKITLFVSPSEISKMTGQKSSNKNILRSEGFDITVKGDTALPKYKVRAEKE